MIVLKLLGLGALGALAGILATPFVLYLTVVVAYVLALIAVLLRATLTSKLTAKKALEVFPQFVKKLPKFADEHICDGNNSKASINYPNPSKDMRQPNIDGGNVSINGQPEAHKGRQADYRPNNQGVSDMPKQPIIKKAFDTVRNLFHSVLLFYRSYYGHSTKVEKNQLSTTGVAAENRQPSTDSTVKTRTTTGIRVTECQNWFGSSFGIWAWLCVRVLEFASVWSLGFEV